MNLIAPFFAGAFLINCVPHLVAGMLGMPFPSPFARPSGIGNSSPLTNFFWGTANLAAGLLILSRHPLTVAFNPGSAALLAGILALGGFDSVHFGKVMRARANGETAT